MHILGYHDKHISGVFSAQLVTFGQNNLFLLRANCLLLVELPVVSASAFEIVISLIKEAQEGRDAAEERLMRVLRF